MTVEMKIRGLGFMVNQYKDLNEIIRKSEEFIIINESEFGLEIEATCKDFKYFKNFTYAMKIALEEYANKVLYGDEK